MRSLSDVGDLYKGVVEARAEEFWPLCEPFLAGVIRRPSDVKDLDEGGVCAPAEES